MSIFDIDYNKLIKILLPSKYRAPIITQYLKVLISGINRLYGRFRFNREQSIYTLSRYQHITHVEAVLNDSFDPGFRRIKIVDNPIAFEPIELFKEIENKPIYFYQSVESEDIVHLRTFDESEFEGADFIIQIPSTIVYDINQLQTLLKQYRSPGASIIIEEI